MAEKRANPETDRGDDFASPGTEPEPSTEPSLDGGGYPSIGDSPQGSTRTIASVTTRDICLRLEISVSEKKPEVRPHLLQSQRVLPEAVKGGKAPTPDDGAFVMGSPSEDIPTSGR